MGLVCGGQICRLPGRSVVIRQLQEMFDRGERPSLTADDPPDITLDVHTVASLLKSYLRELPEPLVPYDAYESVMLIVTREVPVIGERCAAVKLGELLAERLSAPNYNTLQFVCQFLSDVARRASDNKMNETNLATVFAQCFLRPDAEDDPGLMLATSANRSAAALVRHLFAVQRKTVITPNFLISLPFVVSVLFYVVCFPSPNRPIPSYLYMQNRRYTCKFIAVYCIFMFMFSLFRKACGPTGYKLNVF